MRLRLLKPWSRYAPGAIIEPGGGTDFPEGLTRVTCDLRWAEVKAPPVDPCESAHYHESGRYTGYLGA